MSLANRGCVVHNRNYLCTVQKKTFATNISSPPASRKKHTTLEGLNPHHLNLEGQYGAFPKRFVPHAPWASAAQCSDCATSLAGSHTPHKEDLGRPQEGKFLQHGWGRVSTDKRFEKVQKQTARCRSLQNRFAVCLFPPAAHQLKLKF
jgi:hypothetical protein